MKEFHAGVLIFLKANHVEDTLEFDKNLHANSRDTVPHLRHDLPEERGCVCEQRESDLGMATSSTLSSVDYLGTMAEVLFAAHKYGS